MLFHESVVCFFLLLSSIPLYGLPQFIHSTLIACFGAIKNKYSHIGFCVNISFHFTWINT